MMSDRLYRDITLLHSDDSSRWAEFLTKSFLTGQTKVQLVSLDVNTLDYANPPELQVAIQESHVVLLLVSDGLLTYMEKHSDWLGSMLQSHDYSLTSIFAVCLCVSHDDLFDTCAEYSYNCENWDEFELSEYGDNVTQLVKLILGCLDNNYSRLLRKRKMSQKRAGINNAGLFLLPTNFPQAGEKAAVIMSEKVKGQLSLRLGHVSSKPLKCTTHNPYCVSFIMPEVQEDSTLVILTEDGAVRWQLPWMRGAPSSQFTSLALLCQAHGVSDGLQLDLALTQKFKDSVCSEVNVFTQYLKDNLTSEAGKTLYPSMLHWAAAHGLRELGAAILSTPAGCAVGHVANSEGLEPAAMAKANGHLDLADFISQTLETEAIAEACKIYVERGSPSSSSHTLDTEDPAQSVYEIMTSSTSGVKLGLGGRVPTLPNTASPSTAAGPPKAATLPSKFKFPPPPTPPKPKSASASSEPEPIEEVGSVYEIVGTGDADYPSDDDNSGNYIEPDWELPPGAIGSRGQGELITIQQDVKSGTFTISEAERLFRAWKERHQSGHNQSFKEKMASLQVIRSEYSPTLAAITEVGNMTAPQPLNISSPIRGEGRSAPPTMSSQAPPTVSSPGPLTMSSPPPTSPPFAAAPTKQPKDRCSKTSQISSTSTDSGIDSSRVPEDAEEKRRSTKDLYIEVLDSTPEDGSKAPTPPPALPPRPAKRQPKSYVRERSSHNPFAGPASPVFNKMLPATNILPSLANLGSKPDDKRGVSPTSRKASK